MYEFKEKRPRVGKVRATFVLADYKVFQQFEDGSAGEYTGYWPVVVQILMEWAASGQAVG